MPTPEELQDKFWKSLSSDMTMMVGLVDVEDGHARPMTAQLKGPHGPIWFFTSTDAQLVRHLSQSRRVVATFTSKGHDLFASVQGDLSRDTDPANVDALWNRYVAAWFEGGKDDPKLALLRLDADRAEIWEDASSLIAGLKVILGADPKEDYKDKVAKVTLRTSE
jgi:general stress protein 26